MTLALLTAIQAMDIVFQTIGSFALQLRWAMEIYIVTTLSCYNVLVHLSYYVIAYYFRLLKATTFAEPIDDDETGQKENYGDDLERLKWSRHIFRLICRANGELNRVFSFPSLFIISTKLVTTVNSLFTIFYQIIKPNTLIDKMYWAAPVSLLLNLMFIVSLFFAADMPVRQVI